jgi:hypothetical protein
MGGEALLESDVGVGDNQRAQDGVHDGVEGAGGEGSDGERDEADTDGSVVGQFWVLWIACLRIVRRYDLS